MSASVVAPVAGAAILTFCSQDGYFLMMTPLWLAAAATAPPSTFERAWQPSLGGLAARLSVRRATTRRLLGAPGRLALAGLLITPSLLCAGVAAASDEPLELEIAQTAAAPGGQGITRIDVDVTNQSNVALSPHFTISAGQGISAFWSASGGPETLAPHEHARYVLTAPDATAYSPGSNGFLFLRALTDRPMTVSTTRVKV